MKTQKEKDAAREARRAIPGRRAVQVNGMLIPVKTEVPPPGKLCDLCGRRSNRQPDADGKRVCSGCRPSEPPPVSIDRRRLPSPKRKEQRAVILRKGYVFRLCVKCDRKLQKKEGEPGPFLCAPCRSCWNMRTGHRKHVQGGCQADPPGDIDRRIEQLAAMYANAAAYETESEARAAGLPTRSDDIPWNPTYDPSGGADDDATENDREDDE